MNFTIIKEDFLKAIQLALKVIDGKHYNDILSHVLIEANYSQIVFVVSGNTSTQLTQELLNATVDVPGKTLLPAKQLLEIIKFAPPKTKITVLQEIAKNKAEFGWYANDQFFNFEIDSKDFYQYPEWIKNEENLTDAEIKVFHSINAMQLADGLNKITPAIAKQDVRWYLQGSHFVLSDHLIELHGSNGHQMAVWQQRYAGANSLDKNETLEFIADAKIHKCFNAIFGKEQHPLKLWYQPGYLRFSSNCKTLESIPLEGKYPTVSRVLPKEKEHCGYVCFDKKQIMSSLELAIIYSEDKKVPAVKITVDGKKSMVTLTVYDSKTWDMKPIADNCQSLEIVVNAKYLLDNIKQLNHHNQKIYFSFWKAVGCDWVNMVSINQGESDINYYVMGHRK